MSREMKALVKKKQGMGQVEAARIGETMPELRSILKKGIRKEKWARDSSVR